MIPRRRGAKTQKGNPYKLTREQHVIPVATLKRFALADGRVEVHLRDGRIVKRKVYDQIFCVERQWDQRAEANYMKEIEDDFEWVVSELEAGRTLPLSPEEHTFLTRFWLLWKWRNHFIDSPLEDVPLNGIVGERLSHDQKEILESKGAIFAAEEGKVPVRMMTGMRIQMGIDHGKMTHGEKR